MRVRIGVNTGEPRCEPDPITGRMDYFGPMGNLIQCACTYITSLFWDVLTIYLRNSLPLV